MAEIKDPENTVIITLKDGEVVHMVHRHDIEGFSPEEIAAKLTDAEIVETVANVALNILTNYVNHVAQTVVDFPEVKAGQPEVPAEACSTAGCGCA